jgi:CRP/FNR family cyclic AMP-dependent transcriptional regulator
MMTTEPPPFDVRAALSAVGTSSSYRAGDIIFGQGEASETVMFLEAGAVKVSVSSRTGKEAVLGALKAGDFFGERALAGDPVRSETAIAMTATTVISVPTGQMARLLHEQHALSDRFITYLLGRSIRIEADLVDQLFNSAEKRLARLLLLMAGYGHPDQKLGVLAPISQETLAAMVGTTRSRISLFMGQFKRQGFIEYSGGLRVKRSLLSVIGQDSMSGL